MKLVGGTIAVIDATGIALEEKNRVNMAMLGALFRLCPFLDPETMKDVIRKSLEKKYPQTVAPALATFDRGYNEVVFERLRCRKASACPLRTRRYADARV
ncbi:hypothetical protein HMSSN036_56480 [Paenibacillus macerans]|nr:hypothetical protein HMSSN036_56480 [Paenibacillus macerans]